MDMVQTSGLLVWINQFDPFVQTNDASVDIWSYSMAPISYEEAEEAVTQHYRANPGVKAEPGAILKRALQIRTSREAGQRAIEPTPQQRNAADGKRFVSWRQRNPDEWDRLVRQGAADRRADLEGRREMI